MLEHPRPDWQRDDWLNLNGHWSFRFDPTATGQAHGWQQGKLPDALTMLVPFPVGVAASVDTRLSQAVSPGQTVDVPLYASFMTGETAYGDSLVLQTELYGWNTNGERRTYGRSNRRVPYRPWMTGPLEPLSVRMPDEPAVAVLAVRLEDASGTVLHRNFTTFVVEGEAPRELRVEGGGTARVVTVDPASFSSARWSSKQWNVLDGLKVNGALGVLRVSRSVADRPGAGRGGVGDAGGGGRRQAALQQGSGRCGEDRG